jgi:predicted enzyme related to lactoylglutathione lyase
MSRIFSSAEPGPQLTWTAMVSDPEGNQVELVCYDANV